LVRPTAPVAASAVWVSKKTIGVTPSVRSLPMFLLQTLMALTGVGVVIFAVTALPRQRALAQRVQAVLRAELATPG